MHWYDMSHNMLYVDYWIWITVTHRRLLGGTVFKKPSDLKSLKY